MVTVSPAGFQAPYPICLYEWLNPCLSHNCVSLTIHFHFDLSYGILIFQSHATKVILISTYDI